MSSSIPLNLGNTVAEEEKQVAAIENEVHSHSSASSRVNITLSHQVDAAATSTLGDHTPRLHHEDFHRRLQESELKTLLPLLKRREVLRGIFDQGKKEVKSLRRGQKTLKADVDDMLAETAQVDQLRAEISQRNHNLLHLAEIEFQQFADRIMDLKRQKNMRDFENAEKDPKSFVRDILRQDILLDVGETEGDKDYEQELQALLRDISQNDPSHAPLDRTLAIFDDALVEKFATGFPNATTSAKLLLHEISQLVLLVRCHCCYEIKALEEMVKDQGLRSRAVTEKAQILDEATTNYLDRGERLEKEVDGTMAELFEVQEKIEEGILRLIVYAKTI